MGFETMRQAFLFSMTAGFALAVASPASAQVAGAGGPSPISGDSTRITSENRDASATFNQRMGAADLKANGDQKAKKKGPVPATAADIQAGAALRAVDGPQIGSVVSVTGDQVVVDTGESKIAVPLVGFGKDDKGLVLNMTAAKFKDAVTRAHAAHASADSNSN
jgi:hypothetical protein